MNIPLAKIVSPAFSEAFARLAALPLSAKDAYSITKASRLLRQEARDFDTARTTVLKKYGVEQEGGQSYKIEKPEDIEAANAEINELLAKVVELPVDRVSIPSNVQITPRDLMILEEVVKEDVSLIVQA